MSKGKIAIVGSGLIGRNWCMIYTSVGYEVHMYDLTKEQVDQSIQLVQQTLQQLQQAGTLRGKLTADQQFALVQPAYELAPLLKDALHCQECVFEDVQLKRRVFAEIDAHVSNPAMTIASSTSCFLPSLFTDGLRHKANCLVAHPINPPYFIPLVELVPAPWTAPDAVRRVRALLEEVGQSPVSMRRELPGFAVNRIQYAILNECFQLVKERVLSADDVDKVMRDGLGLRYAFMGPWETCHLNAAGIGDYLRRYGQGVFEVSGDLRPLEKIEGEPVDRIERELLERVPLEQLDERKRWRDDRLTALAQLKKRMDP